MWNRIRALHRGLLFVGALICRCATAGNGRSERVAVVSDPPGAVAMVTVVPQPLKVILLTAALASTFSCASVISGARTPRTCRCLRSASPHHVKSFVFFNSSGPCTGVLEK